MTQKILSRYYRVAIQIDDSGNTGDYETAEFQFEQDAIRWAHEQEKIHKYAWSIKVFEVKTTYEEIDW